MKSINIKNTHPKLKVKKTPIRLLVENILSSEKTDLGVDVIFVDDKLMRELNQKFTKRKGTTDVLSFGMNEGQLSPIEYPNLGDVYVSLDEAKRQAERLKSDLNQEIALLVTHGLLHLLGYDHKDSNKKKIMQKKEQIYLRNVKGVLSSS